MQQQQKGPALLQLATRFTLSQNGYGKHLCPFPTRHANNLTCYKERKESQQMGLYACLFDHYPKGLVALRWRECKTTGTPMLTSSRAITDRHHRKKLNDLISS